MVVISVHHHHRHHRVVVVIVAAAHRWLVALNGCVKKVWLRRFLFALTPALPHPRYRPRHRCGMFYFWLLFRLLCVFPCCLHVIILVLCLFSQYFLVSLFFLLHCLGFILFHSFVCLFWFLCALSSASWFSLPSCLDCPLPISNYFYLYFLFSHLCMLLKYPSTPFIYITFLSNINLHLDNFWIHLEIWRQNSISFFVLLWLNWHLNST